MSNTIGEVRLIARAGASAGIVRFYVTPQLSESRSLLYDEISDIRSPGGYIIYMGSAPRTYSITAKMVSRTAEEADTTYKYTHLLKSWTVPNKDSTTEALGGGENTPQILMLTGYGTQVNRGQLRKVPVVISSLNIEYPDNVSYIETTDKKAYIPIVQSFSIELKEARTLDELTENVFDLRAYKSGDLRGW